MAAERPPTAAALFLDRDGVINRKAAENEYVRNWSEFVFLPGAVNALAQLQRAGVSPFIVTNQRGVARGFLSADDLERLHQKLTAELAGAGIMLGGIYACTHDVGQCDCRKPAVGLFMRAQREHPWIDFAASDLVADSVSDLQAGAQLGIRLWLVGEGRRRDRVARQAAELGIRLNGIAASLLALVEDGRLPTAAVRAGG